MATRSAVATASLPAAASGPLRQSSTTPGGRPSPNSRTDRERVVRAAAPLARPAWASRGALGSKLAGAGLRVGRSLAGAGTEEGPATQVAPPSATSIEPAGL